MGGSRYLTIPCMPLLCAVCDDLGPFSSALQGWLCFTCIPRLVSAYSLDLDLKQTCPALVLLYTPQVSWT
jgi:hypothetical protein